MPDTLSLLESAEPLLWTNPQRALAAGPPRSTAARVAAPAGGRRRLGVAPRLADSAATVIDGRALGLADMQAAQDRFTRFAPLLAGIFPELAGSQGQIESALLPVPAMQQALGLPARIGQLWVKADHSLPVAGSIKARGGFHEVLEFAEQVAVRHGLLPSDASYASLARPEARALFARHQVAVGSTGNLGLAIGVLAAALGFRAVVHMSTDAKEWKKERLRLRGVAVHEHAGDYELAVARGRALAQTDPLCHFVDDERSLSLFLGYSAAALHLRSQLQAQGVPVDAEHPLLVYLPCGVGGAPSGIAWGLHQLFGAHVHCFFAEPVQSPCFLLQMLAPPGSHPSVYAHGLSNQTEADGLAVPRASLLAAQAMRAIVAGIFTVPDQTLFAHLALLHASQGLRIEPSAAAGFSGPLHLRDSALAHPRATHLVWTTGGLLVPDAQYDSFLRRGAG